LQYKLRALIEAHPIAALTRRLLRVRRLTTQELNRRLLVSNNYYIRTTQPDHHAGSQKLWLR
jgi:methionyl-tRNA synthetase